MGTKSNHPSPLGEIDRYAVAELLSEMAYNEGWGPTAIFEMLGKACDQLIGHELAEFAEFDPSLKTIKKLIDTGEPINDWHMWAFFLWLQKDYGKELLKKQIGVQLKRKEQNIISLRDVFGFRGAVNPDEMQSLQGTYKLFRPSHVSPTKSILLSQLVIGKEENHFHCSLSSRFTDSFGAERTDFFRGSIVPYGQKLIAIMHDSVTNYEEPGERYAGRTIKGNLILNFDDVDYSANDEVVQGLNGIVLMAVGNGPASAWPINARRVPDGESFEPSEMSTLDFATLPEPIQDSLNRGAVHWNRRYYQASPSEPKV